MAGERARSEGEGSAFLGNRRGTVDGVSVISGAVIDVFSATEYVNDFVTSSHDACWFDFAPTP
jgi:hypothetical protein